MEFVNSSTSRYECLLFDLDDTLYPLSPGLPEACANNCAEFVVQKRVVDVDEVVEVDLLLKENYGTSMAGTSMANHEFDNDMFHNYVRKRLYYENLKPDPILRNLLLSLPYRKLVFSNGDEIHVTKALTRRWCRISSFESGLQNLNKSIEKPILKWLIKGNILYGPRN
ncbi:uncharacterized protein LOC18014853 [Eutrema salsugineum]|uniref:uncharacterized protein LOC18014853 n=1 Tax=Eutrema salsugineum TaxID=72664 RepID=UPI000CECEFDB|nr:uncharacterized protein LOC18014853 [Eutrema salsugineum]